ncbi:helix-turn-helix domain-containing protein [Streptomyces sp. NPDC059165]|uniref:winged helix-turn-helix domain-containing protein n=1 Tax=Streptomyces sp. NPDC059165 TaxID=3346751 RepID=UPI0036A06635
MTRRFAGLARLAQLNGAPLPPTRREFELLGTLARNAGAILQRGQLLDRVWGWVRGASPGCARCRAS